MNGFVPHCNPWAKVTSYYHPFWTLQEVLADGLIEHIEYDDLRVALNHHRHTQPRGTHVRSQPANPALSITVKRDTAICHKECTTCYHNHQLACDALTGLESVFYGKWGGKLPPKNDQGTQTPDALAAAASNSTVATVPSSASSNPLHDLGLFDLMTSRAKSHMRISKMLLHVQDAYACAGTALHGGKSVVKPINVEIASDAIDFAKTVANTHNAARAGDPTARKLDLTWAALDLDTADAPQVAAIGKGNLGRFCGKLVLTQPAFTNSITAVIAPSHQCRCSHRHCLKPPI